MDASTSARKPDEAKARFQAQLSGVFFLHATDLPALDAYLAGGGRLAVGESVVGAEKAGEGNMNYTLRVRTSGARTLIVKQSRPWLEKYPQITAPFERTRTEARFYEVVEASIEVSARMPRLLWSDPRNCVLGLEDLGAASDFFPLYAREVELDNSTLQTLVDYLSTLHAIPIGAAEAREFNNAGMRRLNHEHIFDLPLRAPNGLDLDQFTPGLAAAAHGLQSDAEYRRVVAELGERYLHGSGSHLLHGDFFPGSFLRTAAGVRVIDPEFCFCGDPEFDLGVFAGHLLLAGEASGRAQVMTSLYRPSAGSDPFAPFRVWQYAGIEIMRRLLGVAQIPTLRIDLARKVELLELSRRLVLTPRNAF
jgi:5-methylthioribose kinase